MRYVLVLLILSSAASCVGLKKGVFVQDNTVALVPPRIEVSSSIIDSTVVLISKLDMDDVNIFYTTDESEPTQNSTAYQQPLKIAKSGIYTFKAFHKAWKPSESTKIRLYKKGYTPSTIDWKTNIHHSYPGQGANTLLNHQKASVNYRDQKWAGFDSLAHAQVNFSKKTYVNTLTIGYLIDTGSWIFPPDEIILVLNDKDILQTKISAIKKTDRAELAEVVIPINKEVETISVVVKNKILPDWHPGRGNKAWIFMDEWIFN